MPRQTKRASCAWALHLDVAPGRIRTWEGVQGREYAIELAENALDRAASGGGDHALTPGMLDRRDHLFSGQVTRWIRVAREELFGDVSDRTIFRWAKAKEQRVRKVCEGEDCMNVLPADAPKQRRLCNECGSGAARARRFRARRRGS